VSLSGGGDCIAFTSSSDDLVSGGYGSVFGHVFLHALGGSCPPAPVVSGLSVTHKRFAVGGPVTAISARANRPPRGTAFTFTLSEAASTRIAISHTVPGHRARRHAACKPGRRGRKHNCSVVVVVVTLTRAQTQQGANVVPFSGRYGRHRLAPGKYTATVTAVNAAGAVSAPSSVAFTVVR
jgi:hypothetical protein